VLYGIKSQTLSSVHRQAARATQEGGSAPWRIGGRDCSPDHRWPFRERETKMKIYNAAALAIILATSTASAMDDMLALNLGTVLGSEKLCGLTYDQAEIQAFIEKNVPARDMRFPNELVQMTQGTEYQNKSMSKSAVTAHCTQIARIAKSYGFTHQIPEPSCAVDPRNPNWCAR
jgi:hypothetical protein